MLTLLAATLAAAAFLHAIFALRSARAHLDGLLRELGESIAATAAASLRTSAEFVLALEGELDASLRLKAGFFAAPAEERGRDEARILSRFAVAAGLRHVLLFDAEGNLLASARDVPVPSHSGALDPSRLDLALETAARALAKEAEAGLLVREFELPGAGLKPALAAALPLPQGGTAVLVQDAEAFARARAAAAPDAFARRLEEEARIAYVRFDEPAPAARAGETLDLEREMEWAPGRRGVLRIGLDRRPVLDALAVQKRSLLLYGAVLALGTTLAAWGLLRLREARQALRERESRDDRLASLGRLAAGIAHEVRNPLNAIGIAAQRVQRTAGVPATVKPLTDVIAQEVDRLNRTVEEVLRYARPREPRRERIDAGLLLESVATLARPEAEAAGVVLEVRSPKGLLVDGDGDLLRGAAWNLVRNAIQASPKGGLVEARFERQGRSVLLEVRDRGPGVPPERRASVFEPFQSDRPGGSGLGLPLALSAAEAHGGTIEVRDAPGGGALFVLSIPEGGGGA
jgi:signal transduction histidine kinase